MMRLTRRFRRSLANDDDCPTAFSWDPSSTENCPYSSLANACSLQACWPICRCSSGLKKVVFVNSGSGLTVGLLAHFALSNGYPLVPS